MMHQGLDEAMSGPEGTIRSSCLTRVWGLKNQSDADLGAAIINLG